MKTKAPETVKLGDVYQTRVSGRMVDVVVTHEANIRGEKRYGIKSLETGRQLDARPAKALRLNER